MKIQLTFLAAMTAFAATAPAYATNSTIENALERRSDVSQFYEALVNSGVIDELREDRIYTVFAPTNKAFAKLSIPPHVCYASLDCRQDLAAILRNHIVEGEQHLTKKNALFSIDDHQINIGRPFKGKYTIEGHRVLGTYQLAGGRLYRINGVIMDREERAAFIADDHNAFAPAADGSADVRTDKVYYSPSGRIDGYRQVVTY